MGLGNAMPATAEKSSTTASAPPQAMGQSFFRKRGGDEFFAPARATPAVQLKLTVNRAGDTFEQEADRIADRVMRAPEPEAKGEVEVPRQPATPAVQKKPVTPGLQLKEESGAAPTADADVQSAIARKSTSGQPMAPDVRAFMESRFNADFSNVRIHSDAESAGISNQLGARAFTHRNHLFFSHAQYQPGTGEGKQLLAHELTHTIQQGAAPQRNPQESAVSVNASAPPIQRLGVQDALDYFADKANWIPGFRLLTVILGFNPISRRDVPRSAANILRALVEVIPGGALITQALDSYGVFTKAGAWVEQQLAILGDIGADIIAGLRRFIDSLGWRDIFHLGDVWDRAKAIFTTPIGRLLSFGANVVIGLMKLVRDALLRPLARLAEGTAGYELLKAVLGQDPITGDPVARSADNLIGGFMKLIGQEEIWQNIKKGNAIGRAWAWFQGALEGLMGMARAIPGKIVATITSITWQDVVSIVGVFTKVGRAFLNIAGDFFSWAGQQVMSLLEIIFSVVAPDAVPYIKKARGAFQTIIKNPIGFVGNLVRAGKLGFQRFASNIGTHLKTALIKWITGPLGDAGVYIPQSFSLMEIVKLVLSVLGLTWQNIRAKLLKIIPAPVLDALEKTAGILVTLVKDGPAAAWEQIKAELSELKDMLIAKVTEMITTEVVKAAVTKLVSMLNPAGAVIQAILAIYNTITFFIAKIKQIAAVVGSFIDSIAAIASGQVDNAAKKVEMTMANTLTVIIAFLAKFAGLGNIPDKLVGIVKKIRAPIDKAMDKIVDWLGKVLAKGKEVAKSLFEWWKARIGFTNAAGEKHTLSFKGAEGAEVMTIESTPIPLEAYLANYLTQNKPDGPKKAVVDELRLKSAEIEKLKTNNGKRKRSDFSQEDGEKIKLVFDAIVKLLMLLGGTAPPPTKVRWSPGSGGDGISMDANPLSIDPGGLAGGQPSAESGLWQKTKKRFPLKYVRGHLLNHHVHGAGTVQNLIPVTIGANNRMERLAESAVKKAVLGENKVLHFTVTMTAFHPARSDFPESTQLPSEISMVAFEIEQQGGAWVNKKSVVNEKIASPLP
jgi:hypothetical protein